MRRLEYTINDINYYKYLPEIGSDTVKKIINALRNVYTATYRPILKPTKYAYNSLSVSMFFDTTKNKLVVTYRLDDERALLKVSDRELYNRIYDELITITKVHDIEVEIIGVPTSKPEYSRGRSYGIERQNLQYIRVDTEYMWTIVPGPNRLPYRFFIQNTARLNDDIRKQNMHPKKVEEYFRFVNKINERYVEGQDNPDYDRAFRAYRRIYRYYFKTEPKEVEDWRAFSVYIHITHNSRKEQLQEQEHDRGKILEFEKVKEYIKQWGRDHGRWVPDDDEV